MPLLESEYFSRRFDVKWPFYSGQEYPRAHLEVVTSSDELPNFPIIYWSFFGHIDALPTHGPVSREKIEELKREYPDKDLWLKNYPARRITEILIDAFRKRGYSCGGGP